MWIVHWLIKSGVSIWIQLHNYKIFVFISIETNTLSNKRLYCIQMYIANKCFNFRPFFLITHSWKSSLIKKPKSMVRFVFILTTDKIINTYFSKFITSGFSSSSCSFLITWRTDLWKQKCEKVTAFAQSHNNKISLSKCSLLIPTLCCEYTKYAKLTLNGNWYHQNCNKKSNPTTWLYLNN